ncbi:MAG: STAS domain-containing protein [Magnetococcales bacterium]|nr:STAS domain-containing protein [Magnetococcales bacterium]
MATSISVARSSHSLTISIKGRFNFETHKQFRKIYHLADNDTQDKITHFTIDLSETDYIDSSALGMLLLLREEAAANKATVEISNTHPHIRKILETANFHFLFSIT